MDTSTWSPWPGPLTDWQANWTPAEEDLPVPRSFLASDDYFQLATRPLFQLRDNEPVTEHLRTRASPEQIRVFAVYVTDNDITNGGIWQWLGNSYSSLYPSLLEGHRMLGLPRIADLLEDAVRQVVPDNDLPLDHDARNAAVNPADQHPRHRPGRRPAQPARPDLLPLRSRHRQQRGAAPSHVSLDRPLPRPLLRRRTNPGPPIPAPVLGTLLASPLATPASPAKSVTFA